MKRNTLLLALSGLLLATTACSKDKNEPQVPPTPQPEVVKTVTIDASEYEKYVYFSFEKGEVIATTAWNDESFQNRSDWDLGLHRYEFRTNSGLSGKAQGGAFETEETDITKPIAIPAKDAFVVDAKRYQLVENDHKAGKFNYQEIPVNLVLSANIKYTFQGGSPVPREEIVKPGAITRYMGGGGSAGHGGSGGGPRDVLSGKVYLVRTAKGDFAKIKITDYKGVVVDPNQGTKTKPGFVVFEYVYPVK